MSVWRGHGRARGGQRNERAAVLPGHRHAHVRRSVTSFSQRRRDQSVLAPSFRVAGRCAWHGSLPPLQIPLAPPPCSSFEKHRGDSLLAQPCPPYVLDALRVLYFLYFIAFVRPCISSAAARNNGRSSGKRACAGLRQPSPLIVVLTGDNND